MSRVTRLDRGIVFGMLLLSVLFILFTNVIFSGGSADVAVVEVDGREYGRYSLREKNIKILDVRTQFGYNKIEIAGGEVQVMDTDCPDRLEVKAGGIDSAGEMLVCLPNRLVVRIEGEREVDSVAY